MASVSTFSQEQLEVEGAITIQDNLYITPKVGTIRWNGSDFQGFTHTGWKSLTSGACCLEPCNGTGIYGCNNLVISLTSNIEAKLYAYDAASLGSCSDVVTASFSIDPTDILRTFDCSDLGTVATVELTFWENGSMVTSNCSTTINFADPNGYCDQCNSDTFSCVDKAFNLASSNPPSYSIGVYDLVDIIYCTGNLSAAFSGDPNHQFRTFTCSDTGSNIDIPIFIFNNGVLQEVCSSTISIQDQGGICD